MKIDYLLSLSSMPKCMLAGSRPQSTQQRLRFEHAAFRLVAQFVGALVSFLREKSSFNCHHEALPGLVFEKKSIKSHDEPKSHYIQALKSTDLSERGPSVSAPARTPAMKIDETS